jgi:hypothetical protein
VAEAEQALVTAGVLPPAAEPAERTEPA